VVGGADHLEARRFRPSKAGRQLGTSRRTPQRDPEPEGSMSHDVTVPKGGHPSRVTTPGGLQAPNSTGTPTMLPYSVHEPS
jgi:hypothetical protein